MARISKRHKAILDAMVEGTECPVCKKIMDNFVMFERGRCSNCGADTGDFAKLLNKMIIEYDQDVIQSMIDEIKKANHYDN